MYNMELGARLPACLPACQDLWCRSECMAIFQARETFKRIDMTSLRKVRMNTLCSVVQISPRHQVWRDAAKREDSLWGGDTLFPLFKADSGQNSNRVLLCSSVPRHFHFPANNAPAIKISSNGEPKAATAEECKISLSRDICMLN